MIAERGVGIRSGVNKQALEVSDFPILCETCLGENPYIKMMKMPNGGECKICSRPFTVFRWKAGKGRYKKTEICQTCAKLKNVCQTCLFDLEFGLPVEVRDKMLDKKVDIPKSEANRDYWANLANNNIGSLNLPYEEASQNKEILEKIARTAPYYQRNQAHVCSFWLKGECKRGAECPYRHEKPEEGPLSVQNLEDRFHGRNDPVAAKILGRLDSKSTRKVPQDQTIKTIIIRDFDPATTTQEDLKKPFEKYGAIDSVRILADRNMAFLSFHTRQACEDAMSNVSKDLTVNNRQLYVNWAKYEKATNQHVEWDSDGNEDQEIQSSKPKPPSMPPPELLANKEVQKKFLSSVLDNVGASYPSMQANADGGIKKKGLGKKLVDY